MKLRGLIIERFNYPNVTFHRFYLGIFLGIITSISFYLFFYVCREAVRIIYSSTIYHDLWILTSKETWFYNLIFAFISSIFGEGVCLKTWYERTNGFFYSYFDYRRKLIINDIFVLNTNVLNVFIKIAIVYGIWLSETFGYLEFSLFPKYNYIWILLILVLHLEQWKTIRLIFKNKSLKGLAWFSFIIAVFAFLMSFINPINVKNINAKIFSNSIDYNYQIERPISQYAMVNYRISIYMDLYYVYPKDDENRKSEPTIIFENEIVSIDDLCLKIDLELEGLSLYESEQTTVQLHCDRNIKMKNIKKIKSELAKCGIQNLSYAVMPPDYPYPSKFCRYHGIKSRLSDYSSYSSPKKSDINYLVKPDIIRIEILDSVLMKINDLWTTNEALTEAIYQRMELGRFQQIQLYSNDSVDYQTYINVRDFVNSAIIKWRNKKSMEQFGKRYNQLDSDQKNNFNSENRFDYFELTNKQKEMLEND